MNGEGRKKAGSLRVGSRRTRILYEITGLIVVVLVISGLITFFLVRNSQDELIDKSVEKVIETETENLTTTVEFLVQNEISGQEERLQGAELAALYMDIAAGRITDIQLWANENLKELVDAGLFDMEYIFIIIPAMPGLQEPFVFASSDEEMVYQWKIPDYLEKAMDDEVPYILREDGLPELGLEGAQLVVLEEGVSPVDPNVFFTYASVIPMQEKIGAITAFYNDKRKGLSITLGLMIVISIIMVILIAYFFLRYLIRKRITKPIDELALAAEKAIQGNLDVDVAVHKGGEFEGLEQAFKDMLESIRRLVARSVGEE